MLLLDTNVVSELRKVRSGKADAHVAAWLASASAASLFLSVIVVCELEVGARRVERRDAAQGAILRAWLDGSVLRAFSGRILPVDGAVATRAAALQVPDPMPLGDCLIAATALVHGMTVVTRNMSDFRASGVPLMNPWEPGCVTQAP